MKLKAIKYPEYPINSPNMPAKSVKSPKNIGFEGNLAVKNETADRILNNKFVQNIFETAGRNPHLVQVATTGVLGLTLRPATLLAVPGAEKEDKQYVAAKSIIGTAIFVVTQLLITLPLDKSLKKLTDVAKQNPQSVFKNYSPKQLKAYSFFVSNAVGLALTLATSSFLTVKLTTKIMNKLFPHKASKEVNTQNLQGKERVV